MLGMLAGQLLGSLATANVAGAGIAELRRWGLKLAWFIAVAIVIGLLAVAALGCLGGAAWYALTPLVGPALASAIVGVGLALVAGIIWASCRQWYTEPRRGAAPERATAPLPSLAEIAPLLERHAGTILIAAFAIGMLTGRRK